MAPQVDDSAVQRLGQGLAPLSALRELELDLSQCRVEEGAKAQGEELPNVLARDVGVCNLKSFECGKQLAEFDLALACIPQGSTYSFEICPDSRLAFLKSYMGKRPYPPEF